MGLGSRLSGWLRSVEERPPRGDGVVTLPLNGDQYAASVILAECQAEGIQVQLVDDRIMTHPVTALTTFDLLVFADDLERVQAIAAKQQR